MSVRGLNWGQILFKCGSVWRPVFRLLFFRLFKKAVYDLRRTNTSGWCLFADFPMILITENKTWEEAVEHCREKHHDLISAHNLRMRERVQLISENATTPYVWIGLHYTCVLDFWFWIDNEDFIDSWDPDNDERDFCGTSGAMNKNSTMLFSRSNTEKLNFICSLCET